MDSSSLRVFEQKSPNLFDEQVLAYASPRNSMAAIGRHTHGVFARRQLLTIAPAASP
jgi:hypothetical protein